MPKRYERDAPNMLASLVQMRVNRRPLRRQRSGSGPSIETLGARKHVA
jgi:hypothetical protein